MVIYLKSKEFRKKISQHFVVFGGLVSDFLMSCVLNIRLTKVLFYN